MRPRLAALLPTSHVAVDVGGERLVDVKGHELAELAVDALLLDDLVYVMVAFRLRVKVCCMVLILAVPCIILRLLVFTDALDSELLLLAPFESFEGSFAHFLVVRFDSLLGYPRIHLASCVSFIGGPEPVIAFYLHSVQELIGVLRRWLGRSESVLRRDLVHIVTVGLGLEGGQHRVHSQVLVQLLVAVA